MNITVYGIKNCDTMKKAFNWLDDHGVNYAFHDYRAEGITREEAESWLDTLEIAEVINTRSTTFKELPKAQQQSIGNREAAVKLILSNPTMVKRPLITFDKKIVTGFKPEAWQALLK